MAVLEVIGGIVVALTSGCAGALAVEIVGNIIGTARGLYRVRRASGQSPPKLLQSVRWGFRHWAGSRYDGRSGEYFRLGGLEVPLDIRDKVRRQHIG